MPRRNRRRTAKLSPASKNARRIESAEAALARVDNSRGKPKTQRNRSIRATSDFYRYCSAVLSDTPMSGVDLPGFGYGGRYATVSLVARTNLTAGAGLESSVVLNPYTAVFNTQVIERTATGQIFQISPACMVNSASTPAGFMAGAASGGTQLQFLNAYAASESLRFGGWVRPKFVHFRLIYTGTELNKGGQVQFFHNPAQRALCYYMDSGANAGNIAAASYTTVNMIAQDTENVIPHYIGDSLEFTWRPQSYEFQRVDSYVEIASGTPNNIMNPQADAYLPEVDTATMSTPLGHQTGFRLQPAAGTVASALNYELEIRMEVDCLLNFTNANTSAATAIPGNKVAVSHPTKEALLKNVTSRLHAARAMRQIPHRSTRSGLASTAAESVVTGIASELGSSIAAKLPSLF